MDHIIFYCVGACVALTLEEMGWNAQGKGITLGISFHRSRCVEKFMTGFRIDGRTIKRSKFVCRSVI